MAANAEATASTPPYPPSIEHALGSPVAGVGEASQPPAFAYVAAMCPIGVFDSGLGGLSVVAEVRRLLPYEHIVYFGDNANCPYGERSDEWLRARSLDIATFLLARGAKAIVVACNTASAAGLDHLRARFSVPVVGLVPAVKPAVEATRTGRIGVLATRATIRGRLLADVIERFATPAGVQVITVVPEGLVEAVERGEMDTPSTMQLVARALAPVLDEGVDVIVLGSTHFPFLRPVIRRVAGESVLILDSGEGVARQTRRVLEAFYLLRRPGEPDAPGKLTVYTSGDPDTVGTLARRLTGEQMPVLRAHL